MKITELGRESDADTGCPAVFEAENGMIMVQGPLVEDKEALASAAPTSSDERLVSIPKQLFMETSRKLM